MVVDQEGKPLQFAEVRILDPVTKHIKARTLTDMYGRYLIVSREGNYVLEAKRRDGSGYYQTEVNLQKPDMIDEKITLPL